MARKLNRAKKEPGSLLSRQRAKLRAQLAQKEADAKQRNIEKYEQEKAARKTSGYGYSQHLMGGNSSSVSYNPRVRTFKEFVEITEKLDGKSAKDPGYSLKDWFKGWVQTGGRYDGEPCAKQPGQTTKPYCRDADDRAAMDKDERNKRASKKRREDPNPNRSGSAKIVTQESSDEKDACYKKVKSRYKIWPSAYASGALVKCRKVGVDNWGKSKNEK